MAWRPAQLPFGCVAQPGIKFLQRSEETHEGVFEMRRAAARLMEVAMAELIGARDYGGPHRAVFVGAFGPGKVGFGIDPEGEAHTSSV